MKTSRLIIALSLVLGLSFVSTAQTSVFSHLDTIAEYDALNPPTQPVWGTPGKWVRTKRMNWNTDSYKCYIYKGMPFRLKYPKNFDTTGTTKYPLIVMLHGRGERGSIFDNEYSMKHGGKQHRDAIDKDKFDGFVMYPQNQVGYFGDNQFENVNDIITQYLPDVHVDLNRVSVHGLSAGGVGTWNIILKYPKTFAAALPMSGSSTNFLTEIHKVEHLVFWQFQGGKDKSPAPATTQQLMDACWAAGMNVKYTVYANLGHGVWNTAYKESDFFPFMSRANKTNPLVYFEKTEFCPGDSIYAKLGLTPGFDDYEWRKDGVVISGADSNILHATALGTYDCRFKRGTDWTQWSEVPVVLKMKDSTASPTIDVQGLYSRVLPAPDGVGQVKLGVPGTYEEYAWKFKDSTQTLDSNAEFFATQVGEYVVFVREKFGCESSPSLPFSVIDANGVNIPDQPIAFTGFPKSKTSIQLAWSDNPNPAHNETGFELYRSETSGTGYQLVALINKDETGYTDENLNPDQTYYYILRAVNDDGAAQPTPEVSVMTLVDINPPNAPFNLMVTKTSPTEISLKWDQATDDVGIDKYDVYIGNVKAAVTSDTFATVYNLSHQNVYNFSVRARDFAGNESPNSSVITAAAIIQGLTYSYYHGTWNSLPDFSTLTPEFTGLQDNVDISVRTQNSYYGFVWEGYIDIPVAGNYTFETRSDDGSKLYIGAFDEDSLIVNNDGLHGSRYREGTKHFGIAGAYPIYMTFFEKTGGERMEVYWKNTAHGVTSRQRIPDNAFVESFTYPDTAPAKPSHLYAEATGYNTIVLTWKDNAVNENGFQIYRMEKNEGIYRPVGKVGANDTTWSDTGLPPGTTYTYRIVALGQYGESAYEEMSIKSLAHWGFNNNNTDDSGNNNTSTVSGATYTSSAKEGSHAMDFDGVNDRFMPGPQNLTGIFQEPFSERSISFWMKMDDPTQEQIIYEEGGTWSGITIATYLGRIHCNFKNNGVEHYVAANFSSTDWTHVSVSMEGDKLSLCVNGVLMHTRENIGYTTIPLRNTGALGGPNGKSTMNHITAYFEGSIDDLYFREKAMNASDAGDLMNRALLGRNTETTWPLPPPPRAPEFLVATTLSSSEIQLVWDDSSSTEEYFEIYRSTSDSLNFLPIATVPMNGTTFTDTGLFSNGLYFYKVYSVNGGGGKPSNQVSAVTLNNVPEIIPVDDVVMRYGGSEGVQIFSSDVDNDSITLTALNLPSFASLTDYGDGSGVLTLNPVQADSGVYNYVSVKATDIHGDADSTIFSITVNDNYIPTLSPIASISLSEGDSMDVAMTASDLNGNATLTWSGVDLPTFATIDANTDGTATLNVRPDYQHGGFYAPVSVKVTDNKGAEAIQTFAITVNEIEPNQTVQVNFKHYNTAGSDWNNIGAVSQTVLTNTVGDTTNINLELLTTAWSTHNVGAQTGDNSGVVPDVVLKGYYYFGIWGTPNTVDLKLTGLDPTHKFDISFVGSSSWNGVTDNGHTVYTCNGQTDSVHVQANTSNTADLVALQPDSNGTLTITASKGADATVGYINGFVLDDIYNYGATPAAPSHLTASFGNNQVTLDWYDSPYNETGFNVYRSETQSGPYTKVNGTPLAPNTTTYDDATVAEFITYYYVVQAINNAGVSAYSNEATIYVPNTPPAIAVTGATDIKANSSATWDVLATDPPSNLITMTAIDLPSFATFTDSGSGVGTIVFNPVILDAGDYNFSLKAEDGNGLISVENYSFTVSEEVLYSMNINFSQYNNAASPWNNTNTAPVLNDTLPDLMNDTGGTTTAALTFETLFGGSMNQGAQTYDNSGIVPDVVLKEYYWFGFAGASETAQLKLIGLDYTKKYNLRFVGSSNFSGSGITDNGSTIYSVGNRSVSLDVHANTANEGVLTNVVADHNGEITIDLKKGEGATVGYINAMIVEVLDGNAEVFNPDGLVATAVSSSQINLAWNDNSYDETGYVVYRSLTEIDSDFVAIDSLPANTINYADTGLNNGTIYYYKIRGTKAAGYTEYSETVSTGTISFAVYINLNGTTTYDEAVPWNNLSSAPDDGTVYTGFMNERGNNSGITMKWVTAMQGANDWGTTTGSNSGIYPDNVLKSFYFSDAFDPAAHIRLSGLSQEYRYNISFLGSIATAFTINTSFTIGSETVTNSQANNTTDAVTIFNVNSDINNEVDIHIQEVPGSNWAIFNAMVIEAVKARENVSKQKIQPATDPNAITVRYGLVPPDMEVYPNPISGNDFNLYYEDAPEGNVEITVTDITGRTIDQVEVMNDYQDGHFYVDLNHVTLNSGVYIITAEFEDGRVSQTKMVKQ